jgi:hypothetical protein
VIQGYFRIAYNRLLFTTEENKVFAGTIIINNGRKLDSPVNMAIENKILWAKKNTVQNEKVGKCVGEKENIL